MRKTFLLSLAAATAFCFTVAANGADTPKLKCPVSNKAASTEHSVAYKDAKVYFCCDNCPKEFAAHTKKYATKANAQLVVSGQYKEVKCPLTGKPLNPETAVKIGGVSVQFCCNGCKSKISKEGKKDQFKLVFSDAAFAKGFEKADAADKTEKTEKK